MALEGCEYLPDSGVSVGEYKTVLQWKNLIQNYSESLQGTNMYLLLQLVRSCFLRCMLLQKQSIG
jgi:hypothetical protein